MLSVSLNNTFPSFHRLMQEGKRIKKIALNGIYMTEDVLHFVLNACCFHQLLRVTGLKPWQCVHHTSSPPPPLVKGINPLIIQ